MHSKSMFQHSSITIVFYNVAYSHCDLKCENIPITKAGFNLTVKVKVSLLNNRDLAV